MSQENYVERLQKRVPSANHFVRQSAEALNALQKENLNLKFKLYFLESKLGMPSSIDASEKEYVDLFMENEELKNELREKHEIMKNALDAIEILEEQKLVLEKKSSVIIKEQSKKIEALKTRSKIFRTAAIRKIHLNPSEPLKQSVSKLEEDNRMLKAQNGELFKRIKDLKLDVAGKSTFIENLNSEKQKLLRDIEIANKKLNEYVKSINTLHDELEKKNPEDVRKVVQENEELLVKCRKLERRAKDLERIIAEQSELMKALNRTIEAKNDELREIKLKIDPKPAMEFDRIDISGDGNFERSQFPFHNPLFGSFNSLYR